MASCTKGSVSSEKQSSSPPWLPLELIEIIIREAWTSPLSIEERITLFTSLCRVNHAWLSLFIRIAFKDVHIAGSPFAQDYLRLIREHAFFEADDSYLVKDSSTTVNNICRSLTFHIGGDSPCHSFCRGVGPTPSITLSCAAVSNFISTTLYMVSMLDYLPNLRRISLQYFNWGFDDIVDQGRLMVFPKQVTHLDLTFNFSEGLHVSLVDPLRSDYMRRWHRYWTLPHVRHLSVRGAPLKFVADILAACTDVETLEIDSAEPLIILQHCPTSLHTLVLRVSGGDVGKAEIERWKMSDLLKKGFLSSATSPRIVVHSESTEMGTWETARRLCEGFGIRLVHCRT